MKKMRKEAVLLLLSFVALLGFAVPVLVLQAKPTRTLTLTSIKVVNVAKPQRNSPDVEVYARFNYGQSFQDRYVRRNGSITFTDAYILDSSGERHYMTQWTPNLQQSIVPSRWSLDFVHYKLGLRCFPKSAGKLTFHFTAIAHDKFKLPVSVVVRN